MDALIFFLLFVGTPSLGATHTTNHCREDDHYQNQGEEIRSRLVPASMPLIPANNKNSNVNFNAGSYQQPQSQPPPQQQQQPSHPQSPSQPVNFGTYTEWWEVVTEQAPHGGRHAFSRMDPASRMNSYETIKSRISNDAREFEESRRELSAAEHMNPESRRHGPAPQGAARRSKPHAPQDKPAKSLRSHNAPKNRKTDENADIPNASSRKSNENHNTNVNQNSARRNSNAAENHARRANSNTNKNVNVNDRSGVGAEDNLYDLYQTLGRGSMDSDVGPKALGHPRPSSERAHSNVNHNSNINANVHGDNSVGGGINPEDLRRNLLNKKRYLPRTHHPNDNHNVNININGEEPMDDQVDDLMGDQADGAETESPPN